jgi:hypothetical protein
MNYARRHLETNRFKRAWIWFWYSNATRLLLVLLPTYFVVLLPALAQLGLDVDQQRAIATITYLALLSWAIKDNDYTQLERIGLDVNRRPLGPVEKPTPC